MQYDLIKELTALAVALGLLVYLVTRYLPALNKRFDERMDAKETRFNDSFLEQAHLFKADLTLVVESNQEANAKACKRHNEQHERAMEGLDRLNDAVQRIADRNN